ncbi:MAG: AAA family ATPase [Candidatus Rokubacteria bacterium]|nr:AAA family ATPase [Candidatus Rokubacteria bacterium]
MRDSSTRICYSCSAMAALQELELLIQSRYPLIVIETFEENRLEKALEEVTTNLRMPLWVWTATSGLAKVPSLGGMHDTLEPLKALAAVAAVTGEALFLMKDLHRYFERPEVVRKLQDLAPQFTMDRRVITLSGAKVALPAELHTLAAFFTFDLPDVAELRSLTRRLIARLSRERPIRIELSDAELDQFVERMRGLTAFEAERALTKAMLKGSALTREDFELIVEIKRELLGKEGVLEYVAPEENLAQVGGFATLKAWLAKRKRAFEPSARDFGLEAPRGILLLGVQGCLRGDTRVLLADGRMPSLEALARQASDCLEPGVYDVAYRVALEDGTSALASKLQIHADRDTLLVTFADGRELEATPDHELLTTNGWRRADELVPGDEVRLWARAGDFHTPPRRTSFGRPLHSVRQRKVVVDALPEIWTPDLAELIGLIAAEGNQDRYRVTLTLSEDEDELAEWLRQGMAACRVVAIESGRRLDRVYDLTVPGAERFIANGLVVHNCGKTLAARAVAREWALPLLRMETGRLYDKYIGESEKNLEKALRTAEHMAPCVLLFDEIEKALTLSGSGDSDAGLSRRIFGRLLGWLQDRKAPVFVVATSNDVSQLPPELVRKGRFDEIFFVDLPSREERKEIFAVHLRKRKREPARFDLDALAAAAEGYTGAEIEAAVVAGLYTAFSRSTDLTTQLVLDELAATKPLSVTRKEEVESLRQWARGRTVMAS